jgi:hypothetical protein
MIEIRNAALSAISQSISELDPKALVHSVSPEWPMVPEKSTYDYRSPSIRSPGTLEPNDLARQIVSHYGMGRELTLSFTVYENESIWLTCWAERQTQT